MLRDNEMSDDWLPEEAAAIRDRLRPGGRHEPLQALRARTMTRSTEADRVFNGIVSDILAGVIRPRDRISERDLVSRYGVSRTPVREATKRLLERGFVEPGPKGVAVVVEIGPDDLRKLYTLRLQLEGAAARQIVPNITADEIAQLKQINHRFKLALNQRDLVKMLEIRADFHAVLTRAARNRWLEAVLIMLRDKAYMVRHYHWQDFDRASQTLEIHNQMIKALERRDTEGFAQLAAQQISSAISTYENRLQAPLWNLSPVRVPEVPKAGESRKTVARRATKAAVKAPAKRASGKRATAG